MDIDLLSKLLEETNIKVHGFVENNKASEKYVDTTFVQDDGFAWHTMVPYYSRWSALFLKNETDVAKHLVGIKPYFTSERMAEWRKTEWHKWEANNGNVTKWIFKALLTFKRVHRFPLSDGTYSDNPAKRIQALKDAGYTIASVPCAENKRKTDRMLLPIPLNKELGYETFTPQFKARVLRLLHGRNAFEAKQTAQKALIPDHKFSEIRWDGGTKAENTMEMTDEEIIKKFQLLDNQRNQQKREVCRRCFQEGLRGTIYGIEYYYEGDGHWNDKIPKVGEKAEEGCVGCPWYDIERWRKELNEKIKE